MLEVANSFNWGVREDGIGELPEGVPEEVLELEQERTAEEEVREKETGRRKNIHSEGSAEALQTSTSALKSLKA